jgi:hypothetical protein
MRQAEASTCGRIGVFSLNYGFNYCLRGPAPAAEDSNVGNDDDRKFCGCKLEAFLLAEMFEIT